VLWDVVASEAAKTVTASVSGVFVSGAGKMVQALARRIGRLPDDPVALRELIVEVGRADPAFAAEVMAALAAVDGIETDLAVLPPAHFVDRDQVRELLGRPGVHLVAGAHGVGKTSLVAQVARDVAAGFDGGHAYVDLNRLRAGEALPVATVQAAVLRQLGIDVPDPAPAVLAEQYLRALAHRRCVLIFDNVLGAAEAEELVLPWPASLTLVTTRRLTEDLRAWAPGPPIILQGLDDAGAWRLLDGRCPGMLAAEPDAARQLLALCDNLPFALMQAGGRIVRRRGEPGAVAAVLAELRESGSVDGLIRACIDRSVRELPSAAVADLAALAAQPLAELSQSAAAAVCGHRVDDLVDAGLVSHLPTGRLHLPHLVRGYVSASLDDPGGGPFDRLLAFYRDHAVAADLAGGDRLRRYPVPPGLRWQPAHIRPLDWLETEAPAIAELIAQAYHRRRFVEIGQLCGSLEPLLTSRGHHWLVAGANEWGVLAARALADPALEARLHGIQGRILTQLGLLDRADAALATATRLLAGVDDPHLLSSTTEFQARAAEERGDLATASALFERCIALDATHRLERAAGLHHRMLANVLIKAGRPAEALDALATASAHTSGGDERNEGRVRTVAARAYLALGDLGTAAAELAEARHLVARAGATRYEIELTDLDGDLAWRRGELDRARAAWSWIAEIYWRAGNPRFDRYLGKLSALPRPPR
jgi:hypothetical protein